MVHVTHDGDHGGAVAQIPIITGNHVGQMILEDLFLPFAGNGLVAHFFYQQERGFLINKLIDRSHFTHLHHGLDQFLGLDVHALGQIAQGNGFRYFDFVDFLLRRGFKAVLLVHGALHLAVSNAG